MAKTTDFLSNTRGKINDDYYTRQTETGTVLNHKKHRRVRRSEQQAAGRGQMPNAGAMFRLFTAQKLYNSFENKAAGTNDYNAFIQVNYNQTVVYIPKAVSQAAGCVLANYQYSRGSLPPIRLILSAADVLSTNLNLGSLVIDENTTVAQFSQAVIQNNVDWQAGDQLTFFFAEQWIDSEGVPRATLQAQRMVMSLTSQTKLWSLVSALGFSSVNGYLGMNTALSETGASWIHSRDRQGDTTQVSTQRLMVVSTLLAQYQGEEAMLVTAKSYGGINTREMFLSPQSTMAELGMEEAVVNENENQNGGGSSGSSTGNGGNTGGNGGNTGGNSGSSTGSDTTGTPVLTISKSGSGSATVSAGGSDLNSGAEVAANTEVTVTITPAAGKVPTATIGGNTVTLTESDGTYTGTFQMPSANATLVINTGSGGDNGDTN